ncbi:MAG: DMT family transporter [Acidimicrobiales bacterium]
MTFLVVIGSLISAFLNAWSAVVQRRVAGKPSRQDLFSRNFIVNLTKNKLWLSGLALQILAFLAQAAALREGSITVVEPLMTADLVFLMFLLRWRFRFKPSVREWSAVLALAIGLSGLLLAADPRGGNIQIDNWRWAIAGVAGAIAIFCSSLMVRRLSSRKVRAALAGTAAGINFALNAAFTKLVVGEFSHGINAVFTSWPLYALAISGIISMIVMQSAYASGSLAESQPAIEITDPLISIVIGVMLFGDVIDHSVAALVRNH